jgi:hypothetical protein
MIEMLETGQGERFQCCSGLLAEVWETHFAGFPRIFTRSSEGMEWRLGSN